MTLYDLKKGISINSINIPLSVVLGTFDGLHLGHAELIASAKKAGDPVCVFTFSDNPFGANRIISTEDKLRILSDMGVEYAMISDFSEIREMSWQMFVENFLIDTLNTKTAICGFNFKFGRGAQGDSEKLTELLRSHGRDCIVISPVSVLGEPVSSSRIRKLLEVGDVEKAALLLGRNFSRIYQVSHGNGIGNSLGYPTINTAYISGDVKLASGVYVCSCLGRPAVTNFGVRPTVTDKEELVYETFILDYDGDLYGKRIEVEFLKMLRREIRFESKQALVEQISRDVKAAEEYFREIK